MSDSFYIGYLPKAPSDLARFTRRRAAGIVGVCLGIAAAAGAALPYFGAGLFEFGRPQDFTGVMRCDVAPVLQTVDADIPLVGPGKHTAPLELCGGSGRPVVVTGTRIARDGRTLLEVAQFAWRDGVPDLPHAPAGSLGRFSLTGEIVDAKCYFGVMNPGEGRVHRACARQCLRGGIPAVFIARDQTGATLPLLIDDLEGGATSAALIRLAGEAVVASGQVSRQGRWLVLRPASVALLEP
jgi:hypothetical protein